MNPPSPSGSPLPSPAPIPSGDPSRPKFVAPRPNIAHAHTFLAELIDPKTGPVEFRIIGARWNPRNNFIEPSPYSSTLSGYYDDIHCFVADAQRLRGISGYVTINPVDPALRARAYNKLVKSRKESATSDVDIVCLRRLFIDIDPVRKPDISSTDEELAFAIAMRDRILSENPAIAGSAMWGKSGNGAWILARLPDYPNDESGRRKVAHALGRLAERYSNQAVKVDPTTKNPSRIMCIPGFVKCKGDPSGDPARPWRLATLDGMTHRGGGAGISPINGRDGGESDSQTGSFSL